VIHWATQTRQARIGLHLGASAGVLILLTVPFWIWPIDLWIQARAWQGTAAGWSLGEQQPWKMIYHLGTLPALVLSVLALAVVGFGSRGGVLAPWSKVGTDLVICMAIGPGLVVNLGLKDHWGSRGRGMSSFGGEYRPETVWIADPSSPGKSFPCGHVVPMGFYFFAPGLLLWRFRRRRTAVDVFAGAVIGGLLLGAARILQGGHFASDVLWGEGSAGWSSGSVLRDADGRGAHLDLGMARMGAARSAASGWSRFGFGPHCRDIGGHPLPAG